MKNRLRRNEKDAIRQLMTGNPIWNALQNPTRKYEREFGHLRLSAEEVLLECLALMDEVKECPNEAALRLDGLWDAEYCDLRDLNLGDAEEGELTLGASLLTYVLMLMMSMCRGTYYTRLTLSLMNQITEHDAAAYEQLQASFMPNVWRMGEEQLRAYIAEYMDSIEQWLSDDLTEKLQSVPAMTIELNDDRKLPPDDGKKAEQLSNRQLIILFELLMNKTPNSQFVNVSALAKLLSLVSGNSAGSIRQKIMTGIDYDDEQTKRDVEYLATLVEPISPEIAQQLRETIE